MSLLILETMQGFDSLMVDGSHLSFEENISYTKDVSFLAHSKKMLVEAELGRLSGTEDGLTVEDYEAKLTDVTQVNSQLHLSSGIFYLIFTNGSSSMVSYAFQAQEFIEKTGIEALAVCIGNVHGKYPASGPKLRLDLLKVRYLKKGNKKKQMQL